MTLGDDKVGGTAVENDEKSVEKTVEKSVEKSMEEKEEDSAIDSTTTKAVNSEKTVKHPLQNTWTLWYLENDRTKSWEEMQNEITSFDTVEDFWR